MSINLFNAGVASTIIASHYETIIDLTLEEREDSLEFNEAISRQKRYIDEERNYYLALTQEEIDAYFEYIIDRTRFNNRIDGRIYMRMSEMKRLHESIPFIDGDILFSSVISSKITIDVLKQVEKNISSLTPNDELDEEDINTLKTYAMYYKYHHLTSNAFIERLALDNGFDILKIPTLDYHDIEDRFKNSFLGFVQAHFYYYIIATLEELVQLESENKYLLIYSKLFETARIEAMLPHLDHTSLEKLVSYIGDHSTKYSSNSALVKIKKMIYKRKEEFNI